ncbi:helicase-like protein [Trypanosoma brucei brucei TREU927]|uniref:Helicase-like protein n=1 Tax=Trypanosoma brucei brucei (strain 927/4 GUTat10.1) TaxID=185431 RepID=Q383Z6_TRYB2|nr:helicase [Trypanosoma brucei brucei TREU927]EAN79885.1 helicase-like protein [Trypanosoma brucei brucei TREU927]
MVLFCVCLFSLRTRLQRKTHQFTTRRHALSSARSSRVGVHAGLTMTEDEEPYVMAFEPYTVQREMMRTVHLALNSWPRHTPIAAIEVPTGCGKTLALLSSVLRYQAGLEKHTPQELEQHFRLRRCRGPPVLPSLSRTEMSSRKWCHCKEDSKHSEESNGLKANTADGEEAWRVSSLFLRQFRPPNGKRLRVELVTEGSLELRKQHQSPPCTIFYVTRTHAQLRQCVGELRKLKGLERLKMNILGSRKQYCINQHVLKACANKTLPIEGNNLGEVCDKLVSLGQCEAVHGYGVLGSKAITHPLSQGRSDKVWDIEDLVTEGVGMECCPYYAARDLVFFAHINFATYQYLLDPLIRHECKMEAALKNHSIIIFDEAHNVPQVCQDALSVETSVDTLRLILNEIEPLIQPTVAVATLSYPREFKLTKWTLVELLSLLYDVFKAVTEFVSPAQPSVKTQRGVHSRPVGGQDVEESESNHDVENNAIFPGETLAEVLRRCITDYIPIASSCSRRGYGTAESSASKDGVAMFRQVYGIIMSLGVTFNPFQFSIFCLSLMKRWILIMRFIIQKPSAFVLSISDPLPEKNRNGQDSVPSSEAGGNTEGVESAVPSRRIVGIRCLDGSLAFQHILSTAHRVVLASGTLAPFHQLGRDLGIPPSSMATYEGLHVAQKHQYRLGVLTHTVDATPLHCTYGSLKDPSFISQLVETLAMLVEKVELGGVLVFMPNYTVMKTIGLQLISRYRDAARQMEGTPKSSRFPQVFLESQSAADFPSVLDSFRKATVRGPAVFASVFRAKVSEGIDFADCMARLVVCVGVPLQPLKSWTVQAQRRYSGEEWYVNDAVRAVNQALGRCIRHSRDFGAMVLLDDRFEQMNLQQSLSRWCREELRVHHSHASLADDLHEFFRTCRGGNAIAKDSHLRENVSGGNTSQGEELYCRSLEKENVPPPIKEERVTSILDAPFLMGPVLKPKVPTYTRQLSCTALKLMYEAHDDVSQVTAEELREALRLLEDGFPQ